MASFSPAVTGTVACTSPPNPGVPDDLKDVPLAPLAFMVIHVTPLGTVKLCEPPVKSNFKWRELTSRAPLTTGPATSPRVQLVINTIATTEPDPYLAS
jgi:hypothetical protein